VSRATVEIGGPTMIQHEQCPFCEGLVPHDAIVWRPARRLADAFGPFVARHAQLDCPHCGCVSTLEIRQRTVGARG
jgi:hypothetical protein